MCLCYPIAMTRQWFFSFDSWKYWIPKTPSSIFYHILLPVLFIYLFIEFNFHSRSRNVENNIEKNILTSFSIPSYRNRTMIQVYLVSFARLAATATTSHYVTVCLSSSSLDSLGMCTNLISLHRSNKENESISWILNMYDLNQTYVWFQRNAFTPTVSQQIQLHISSVSLSLLCVILISQILSVHYTHLIVLGISTLLWQSSIYYLVSYIHVEKSIQEHSSRSFKRGKYCYSHSLHVHLLQTILINTNHLLAFCLLYVPILFIPKLGLRGRKWERCHRTGWKSIAQQRRRKWTNYVTWTRCATVQG